MSNTIFQYNFKIRINQLHILFCFMSYKFMSIVIPCILYMILKTLVLFDGGQLHRIHPRECTHRLRTCEKRIFFLTENELLIKEEQTWLGILRRQNTDSLGVWSLKSGEECTQIEKSPSCPLKNRSHRGAKGVPPFTRNMKATFGLYWYGYSSTLGTNEALHMNSSSVMVCHSSLGSSQSERLPQLMLVHGTDS